MTAIRLTTKRVAKPWGRVTLWPGFADASAAEERIGEIWFEAPATMPAPLLIKYLFTSERLSVQVHPNDEQARAAGYPNGKDEAWLVLAAEADSTIALGTKANMSASELRAAAEDGSIEHLLDWRRVVPGDVIYSPAGTVHAIGAGITVLEIQQNLDLTYRLYDYGRPRELHLDEGVAVSVAVPFATPTHAETLGHEREILVQGHKFVVERWRWHGQKRVSLPAGVSAWLVPVSGSGTIDAMPWRAGECWSFDSRCTLACDPGSEMLLCHIGEKSVVDLSDFD